MNSPNKQYEIWITRCFELARRGLGFVSPNPPVGAVLVFQGRIIGEGYHTHYGAPHAEVECILNVSNEDRHLIPESTLFISLEPCCTTGKTPPCTDLIIKEKIPKVVVATHDPNPLVAGKGITILRSHGIEVIAGILETEARYLIRAFTKNILTRKPYIILKWAQSQHGFIGKKHERIWLSHPHTTIWAHQQRTIVDAIIIGARTVIADNPLLTVRDYEGKNPHRVIYDPNGKLSTQYRVFNQDGNKVFYFSTTSNSKVSGANIFQFLLDEANSHVEQMLTILFESGIGILLVEGGRHVHQLFIKNNDWNEACIIQTAHPLKSGIAAPNVHGKLTEQFSVESDNILRISNAARQED